MKDRRLSQLTAFTPGQHELHWPTRAFAESMHPNLVVYEPLDFGGHFLAAEVPDRYVDKCREYFSIKEVAKLV
jgi:hypothetical protein